MLTTRRSFLKLSAAAASSLGFPAVLRAAAPNSRLRLVAVGCSGKGWDDISQIGSHPKVEFAALCDVDTGKFAQAARKYPVTPQYQDYREAFSKLGDGFDAVIVSTPDHLHAVVAMEAMRRGKHVYCQKPLTHTLWEARQMHRQAEQSRVITQMGNQIHSHTHYRTGVRWLQSGAIGKIKVVHSWQAKTGNHYTGLSGALPPAGPVPETLNWDLWLGPAPQREFSPKAYHPAAWRDWQDFGGGVLGDFGCHIMDPVFTALKLKPPISISAENDGLNPQTWPVGEVVRYVFAGTEYTAGEQLPLTWYDGGRQVPEEFRSLFTGEKKMPNAGSIFVGEGGMILLPHVGAPEFVGPGAPAKPVEVVEARNHYHSWVDAILANEPTTAGFHYAGPLTETVHLGNIATRMPGVTLTWEGEAMKFPGHPEAEKLLTKAYRPGWQVPAAGAQQG